VFAVRLAQTHDKPCVFAVRFLLAHDTFSARQRLTSVKGPRWPVDATVSEQGLSCAGLRTHGKHRCLPCIDRKTHDKCSGNRA
jgi:hypothetical protein